MTDKVFFSGVPVGPDVRKLLEEYGIPEENTEIKYLEIEKIIGESYLKNRFKTVTNAWVNYLLKAHNVLMIPVRGVSYVATNPNTRVEYCSDRVKSAIKMVGKRLGTMALTDKHKLTEDNKNVYDKHMKMYGPLKLLESTAAKPAEFVRLGKENKK